MFQVQNEVANLIQPFFARDGLVAKSLEYSATQVIFGFPPTCDLDFLESVNWISRRSGAGAGDDVRGLGALVRQGATGGGGATQGGK